MIDFCDFCKQEKIIYTILFLDLGGLKICKDCYDRPLELIIKLAFGSKFVGNHVNCPCEFFIEKKEKEE